MEANHRREIKSGAEFNHLFPKPIGNEVEIKRDADVAATVAFIPKVVFDTLSDTSKIAKLLKGNTLDETCENIWDFVYEHIQYAKDKDGIEQIRRPARVWYDRVRGVDCDCYTVFISSILTNLHIPHIYRITKYKSRSYFQHIYPIVPTSDGGYITLDCVVNEYNYEEPYTEKKDTPMRLHYLNGIDDEQNESLMATDINVDTYDLMGADDFEGMGKINLNKLKEGITKVVHFSNRLNPATGLLRAGLLVSMKLNLMKIANRIRYAYLSDEQAQAKHLDMDKFHKLKKILAKLEKIFYGAGGKPENLKKAILTGKGNKDHEVSGLGMIADTTFYDENTPLHILLSGIDEEEMVEGLNGLGIVATAAIAAASSALSVVSGLIKQVGGVKKGASTGASEDSEGINESTASNTKVVKSTTDTSDTSNAGLNAPTGFLEKTKAWVKENPVQAGVVAVGITALGVLAVKHFTKKKASPARALSGVHHKKRKTRKTNTKPHVHRHKHSKAPIALL
jgi:hypothetical protein